MDEKVIALYETHTQKELAKMFNVEESTIKNILSTNRVRKSSESKGLTSSRLRLLPLGTKRDRSNGVFIKVGHPSKWISVRKYAKDLWEAHNGKVPKGKGIVFINGDEKDVRLENITVEWK